MKHGQKNIKKNNCGHLAEAKVGVFRERFVLSIAMVHYLKRVNYIYII